MKMIFAIGFLSCALFAQPLPEVEREFRGAWIATVDNIDFPTKQGLPMDEQKAELIASLDLVKTLRLNAVIFQVRPAADAIYSSKLEPWSEYLTGQMGKSQVFDPLEFIVNEAHRRGILVHAWFNPYRAYHPSAKTMSDDHISKSNRGIVRQYGRYMWLDPTDPAAKKHSLNVIADVVRRYDIDGVHFDDYFYPYAEKDEAGNNIDFPDHANWEKYKASGGKLDRGDWRRSHVNDFIASVGRAVKRIKPQVMYGISPFGIWQPMPQRQIVGFNAYAELYADARKWLQDGTVDYLAPQLYWETGRQNLSFPVLLDWWKEQNTKKRHIWPGVATYRIGRPGYDADMIAGQIRITRKDPLTLGAIHFSFKSLRNDMGGIQAKLREAVYKRDAIIPASPWMKVSSPRSPKVTVARSADHVRASWPAANGAFWYVVYAKDKDAWSYSIVPAAERSITLSADRKIETIVVKSVDRLGNVSQ
ncbi:MAG: family 10 glycosylhydrolase [bacterium]|nr:family 10 glycosylhydrolase [bacterium]